MIEPRSEEKIAIRAEDQTALRALESRIRAILPEQYQDCYEDVQPLSMGTAGLKYDRHGRVAWGEMWGTFCDLAMAGGPPHKGTLLEPGIAADIEADCGRYAEVVEEICRGIEMVTGLVAECAPIPGWICVDCVNGVTAEWLLRAITTENISARCQGTVLELPAGPAYRLDKEIKNVITVIAKTCHYWFGHTPQAQRADIRRLFAEMEQESPLLRPASEVIFHSDVLQALKGRMADMVCHLTGLHSSTHRYSGWLGMECRNVAAAIWMMRALVGSNVLSRREGTVVFLPVDPIRDPSGEVAVRSVVRLHAFAAIRGMV